MTCRGVVEKEDLATSITMQCLGLVSGDSERGISAANVIPKLIGAFDACCDVCNCCLTRTRLRSLRVARKEEAKTADPEDSRSLRQDT